MNFLQNSKFIFEKWIFFVDEQGSLIIPASFFAAILQRYDLVVHQLDAVSIGLLGEIENVS